MKISELRSNDIVELEKRLIELLRSYFNLRVQKLSGQLVQFHLLKFIRRDIARIKTVLNEKNRVI